MKVLCVFLVAAVAVCCAAPGSTSDEESKLELFSGVAIEKDQTGDEKLNVKFEPGELREAARTFEEARGKIKKYTPLLASVGVKVIAIVAILFGGLTLLVTKALVVAKLAFLAAAALGLQKYLSAGSFNNFAGKISGFQSGSPQWNAQQPAAATYPYARSSNLPADANDLAYKAQLTS